MQAMILAAGLGTRLKPWTEHHPKALVPVGGVPMLRRVMEKLKSEGFDRMVVNVHHFSDQIKDYLMDSDFGMEVAVSDESDLLLDTGGGLLKASSMMNPSEPVLVHNVDILSTAPLRDIMESHAASGRDITLVTSGRDSSRRLLFDAHGNLAGWHNLKSGEYRPEGFVPTDGMTEEAFSGIYVIGPEGRQALAEFARSRGLEKFPIMDFLLSLPPSLEIGHHYLDTLRLIDIGKPDTLSQADALFK